MSIRGLWKTKVSTESMQNLHVSVGLIQKLHILIAMLAGLNISNEKPGEIQAPTEKDYKSKNQLKGNRTSTFPRSHGFRQNAPTGHTLLPLPAGVTTLDELSSSRAVRPPTSLKHAHTHEDRRLENIWEEKQSSSRKNNSTGNKGRAGEIQASTERPQEPHI